MMIKDSKSRPSEADREDIFTFTSYFYSKAVRTRYRVWLPSTLPYRTKLWGQSQLSLRFLTNQPERPRGLIGDYRAHLLDKPRR